jgi:S1-C subfamily serine protease
MNIDTLGTVVSVVPGSPAAVGELRPGAKIVAVNGVAVTGKPAIVEQLQRAPGAGKAGQVVDFGLQFDFRGTPSGLGGKLSAAIEEVRRSAVPPPPTPAHWLNGAFSEISAVGCTGA